MSERTFNLGVWFQIERERERGRERGREMVMLCFVLDLRSLSPPLLRELKQSLLQLANYYAIYSPVSSSGFESKSKLLLDRIGLCYIFMNRNSCSAELKVAYSPRGNFNLRDFHHAVNNLPTDAFSLEFSNSGLLSCSDMRISSVLDEKVLYSWGDHNRDITRKVVLISCSILHSLDFDTKKILMDAADKCVSVEFVFLEHKSSHLGDIAENITNFVKQIGDLENCSFRSYLSDELVFPNLVKRWFQELKDDMEGLLQCRFMFKTNMIDQVNQIFCNFYRSLNPMIDGFISCQTCRCHGIPLDKFNQKQKNSHPVCPVKGHCLGEIGLIKNSIKVGESTILFMPSFQCSQKLLQINSPIDFNVVERINLGTLSEGYIFGSTYTVAPSTCQELDDTGNTEQNTQVFQVLCHVLNSLDQGLVCFSNCNVETMGETSFRCFYVLLPSDKGVMLLRRLVAAEEILPILNVSEFICSKIDKEMENSVRTALLKIEASDYNPLQHERGFHQKLNLLVKESLQFGAIPLKIGTESNLILQESEEVEKPLQETTEENILELDKVGESSPCITEEWENLFVTELPTIHSPTQMSKAKLDSPVLSPLESNRHLDQKTSRILERLEVPRQLKRKTISPKNSGIGTSDAWLLTKKPLIPYVPNNADDQGIKLSQPIKPTFQRLKRKR